jgi:endonuclease/exonuclease/phosphatase family metal-dependent hydrolase
MKMLDTFRVVLPEEKNVVTFNSFRAPRLDDDGNMIGAKIDYIFVTPNLKTTDAEIIRTNDNGRYPSDHYPIRATVEFAD